MSDEKYVPPSGATHYHKGNDDWSPHYIKVYVDNILADEVVHVWCDIRPEWGHWSGLPVWDEDNKGNYIKLDKQA